MTKTWKDIATEILEKEAVYLDDQRWDDWLGLFALDCNYWVPTWRTQDELTTNPRAEISHIFYADRAGLEDRIIRIRSGRSPASSPIRRTAHVVGPIIKDGEGKFDEFSVRSTWVCHVFDPHHKECMVMFGYANYTFRHANEGQWLIFKKKTVVQNDYFPSVVDIYCI